MIIINNNAYISILPLFPRSRRAHVPPEEDWDFPGKNCLKLACFCITKIRLGEISSRKEVKASNFVKTTKNPAMIQLNRVQLTSQTPNHVEITKILSTGQRESKIIDC